MILRSLVDGNRLDTLVDSVDFDLTCDLLCVGAGCSGVYLSDSAKRMGADVILIENEKTVGGMHTVGGVRGYYYGYENGAFMEDDQFVSENSQLAVDSANQWLKQVAMIKRLESAGVKTLFEHSPTGVWLKDDRIVGLQVFDGNKLINVRAKITVDATSDGHIIIMAGAKTRMGRPADNKTVPFSVISNYLWNDIRCGVNQDAGEVNQYDVKDFSKKLLLAHKDTKDTFKKGDFLYLATITGVREGVSFEGEHTMKYTDLLVGNTPENVLFWAYSDLDRHGNDRAIDDELFQNWWVISNLATVAMSIPVPIKSLIPKGLKGLVSAGRCLSCDSYLQSAVRMIRDMFRMGECLGIACALAIKQGVDIDKIDYEKYLSLVKDTGAFGGENKDFAFNSPSKKVPYVPIDLNPRNNLHLLDTTTPGACIWTCFLNKEDKELVEILVDKMNATKSLLEKYNCAIALGIMEQKIALPVLREIVNNRDCFYFTDCRRSNQFRSAVAICLLGRLGEIQDATLLESIVFSDTEFEREMYHTLEHNYLYYKLPDRNFVYFDVFTHGLAGLVKLYKKLNLNLSELNEKIKKVIKDGKVVDRIAYIKEPHQPTFVEITDFLTLMLKQTEE